MSASRYGRLAVSGLALGGLMATVTAGPAIAAAPRPTVTVVPGVDISPPGDDYQNAWKVNNRGQVLLFVGHLVWQNGRYTDVGTLGGTFAGTWAINDSGDVVGESELADGTNHGFRWRRGRMTDVGTLGGTSSIALSVGANGDVAGRSTLADGSEHVFRWRNGVITDTGITSSFGAVIVINAQGRIATSYLDHDTFIERAYVWDRGVTTVLPTLGGDSVQVSDINDRGDVVGRATTVTGDWHAFLWRRGRMIDLGTLGGAQSSAADINNRGQIVGIGDRATGPAHAFRWDDGVMRDLDAATGAATDSSAAAINERGDVVGIRQDGTGNKAVVWRGRRLLVLDTIGAETSQGQDINDSGLAIGQTSNPFAPTRAAVWNTAGY